MSFRSLIEHPLGGNLSRQEEKKFSQNIDKPNGICYDGTSKLKRKQENGKNTHRIRYSNNITNNWSTNRNLACNLGTEKEILMLIQQKVSILVPNIELGTMIAQKDSQVQSQVLLGFARVQLLGCKDHSQAIISLANLLTPETFLWLSRLYEESKKRQWITKINKKEI